MSDEQKPTPPTDWGRVIMHVSTELATVLIILGCLGSCTACAVYG